MPHPIPGQKAPELEVETLGGQTWRLSERQPEKFTMVVFYRGLHCPICSNYLADLNAKLEGLGQLGVEAFALSCDPAERAEQARQEWDIGQVDLGHSLSIDTAKDWGLYISEGINDKETRQFCEPGLFLVRPDNSLFYAGINSMPFGRPKFDELMGGIEFVSNNNYPARGRA